MRDTLHLLSNGKSSFPNLHKQLNFPSSHRDFSSLFCSKALHFPILASKAATIPLPPKPSKIPEIPSKSPPLPTQQQSQEHQPNNDFQEKLFYLDSIGLDIFSLIEGHRQIILSASLEDIKSTVDLLTSINFTAPEFRRIFSMCPEILASNAATILPIFTFLLREARVDGANLKHVIHRRPRLLASSVKHCLRPTLYFLQSIGIAEVKSHTYLLSCSVENKLIPRIRYFENIGFSYKESVTMFRRFPQLFNYSIKDNVEPKLNYFVVEMGRDLKELKEFPQYFSFSLENRIKPRHQICSEKDVYFPLRVMLKINDAQFQSRLEVCCNSSIPLSTSPLSSVNWDNVDSYIE